ncbi:MAG: hypothetical protein JNL05_10250 [Flavobacteriales bacterium]|nr:hypothetical protein [Flavobacteriales bacterium]
MPVRALLVLLLLLEGAGLMAQEVTIRGRVVTSEPEHTFYDLMVVNRRTRNGSFGNADGTFTVRAQRTDTLLIAAGGFQTRSYVLEDTVLRDAYDVTVELKAWRIELKPLEVLPERTLKEIQADIDKLGYNERDYRLSTVNAFESPITFLYQEFSKRERSRRLVAELRNEDRKRELLKELLHKYVEYDIINLSDESFDDFIDFCAVPDEVIKGLSQYEFLTYVQRKYELYTSLGPTRQH